MTSSSGVWHFFFLDLLVSKPKNDKLYYFLQGSAGRRRPRRPGSHPSEIKSRTLRTATRNLIIQDSEDVDSWPSTDRLPVVLNKNFAYRESFLLDLDEE